MKLFKMIKRKSVLLLLTGVLAATSVMQVSAATGTSSSSNSLSQAQQDKEALESALKEAQDLISDLQNSQDDIESKIKELDTKMTSISNQIAEMETELDNKNAEITDTQAQLAQAQEDAANQYASMKLRIQYMYENGSNMSYLQLFLESQSISDFLDSADYIYQLSEYDRDMLQQYQDSQVLIANTEEQLRQDYADLQTMQAELEDQKSAVAALKQEKQSELSDVGVQLDDAEENADIYESEIQAQNEIIAEIQAELAAEAARVEAAKAAAAAAAANGETSTEAVVEEITYNGGAFKWPCPSSTRVTSDYGSRLSPTAGASSYHKGIDIGASYGADIVAAADGEVIKASYSSASGNYIIINHGSGLCTVYMHASSLNVSAGQTVTAGQTIAKVGSTGISTGNHLHFGVSLNGSYVSPWNYLS